jgi:hypothetical protein
MGNWVFVRRHALYEGLSADQVMRWEYQVAYEDASGLLVDGEGVEVFAGHGRDNDATSATAIFSARMGRGTVLFQAVRRMQLLVYRRLNAERPCFSYVRSGCNESHGSTCIRPGVSGGGPLHGQRRPSDPMEYVAPRFVGSASTDSIDSEQLGTGEVAPKGRQ